MRTNYADTCQTYVQLKFHSARWGDTQIKERKGFTDDQIVIISIPAIRHSGNVLIVRCAGTTKFRLQSEISPLLEWVDFFQDTRCS